MAGPKGKTQDVFCNRPPLQSFRVLLTPLTYIHVGNYAPVKTTGVPTETTQSSCCEKTRLRLKTRTLKQFSQKAHDDWAVPMACLRWSEGQKRTQDDSITYNFIRSTCVFNIFAHDISSDNSCSSILKWPSYSARLRFSWHVANKRICFLSISVVCTRH